MPRSPIERRSIEAATQAAIFLLLGLGVIWFAKAVVGITSGAVLSVLIIVPMLLYVILRGYLTELRGPGGWAATFKVTNATISFAAQKFDMGTKAQVVPKSSIAHLEHMITRLDRDQPVLMTVNLGEPYDVQAMRDYLRALMGLPQFKLIVFLDPSGYFVGCASPSSLNSLIQNQQLALLFLRAVAQGNVQEMFRYPGILKDVIKTEATNAEALAAMDRYGLDMLAVVDQDHRIKGVTERQQLMSTLILSLVSDATGDRQ